MMTLEDIRQYISGLGIAEDEHVYIGKLDNKQERSIGVYNRKGEGTSQIPLGGMEHSSYDIRRISLLIHWNKSVAETEEAARRLYEKLLWETQVAVGENEFFLELQVPEPVDVGTDDNGIYEYVIWMDFICMRK